MLHGDWFFGGWAGLIRVVVVGVAAYLGLVTMVRISGKRTLAKLNAFDLVVTVALGSTLATVLVSSQVTLAEGLLALGLLVGLQYVVAKAATRSDRFENLVKSEPRLLARDGEFMEHAMTAERVTRREVLTAVRSGGAASLEDVAAVVLETDGSISVITRSESSSVRESVDRARSTPHE